MARNSYPVPVPAERSIPAGAWAASLWELEDTRRRTLEAVSAMDPDTIDQVPAGFDNSIGALLHHIALIEADWLYADILAVDYPAWMLEVFPDDDRDQEGHLVPARRPLASHLETLGLVRTALLSALSDLPDSEFTMVRREASAQWVIHHLRQHEAEHRGQIQSLVTALDYGRNL
ncbi:hypothetical protein BH18ACT5_BH18ACT5_08440 [soil metagenome]